jgi:hypothetical protein
MKNNIRAPGASTRKSPYCSDALWNDRLGMTANKGVIAPRDSRGASHSVPLPSYPSLFCVLPLLALSPLFSAFNAIVYALSTLHSFYSSTMRPRDSDPDFFSTSQISAPPRSLRLFPRDATNHGLRHTTIIIIAVAASVGSLLLAIIFWRILLRLSERSKSAPLPQRQALVHQRERQLVAFTEHNNASVPKIFADDTSNATSSFHLDADERTKAALHSSSANQLHPPTPPFFTPQVPTTGSSTSLHSSYGRSSPSSDGTNPRTANSPSMSPSLSVKRSADPQGSRQRPQSMASIGTTHTIVTERSRTSIRGAPHAPHNNVQIVLPAPLAPSLHQRPASAEPRLSRPFGVDSTYMDSWRSSLVDTWVAVGQHGTPEPEHIERQRRGDSMERRGRLPRSMCVAFSVF